MTPERAWSWVLRLAGLAGVVHETVVSQLDRPFLLGVFLAMMGLSDVLERFGGRR